MANFIPSFGRLEPSPEKQDLHEQVYSFSLFFPFVVAQLEKTLVVPEYKAFYNQGNIGACTGYSASWMSSITNNPEKYNAYKLYKRGQAIDNDPNTKGDNDGGYIWAVCDVLRKEGHWEVDNQGTQQIDLENGIESYHWAKTIDEMRTAIELNRPLIFGIRWYEEFMSPRTINGEFWIGTKNNWGQVLGGHAICSYAGSDERQAFKLVNSWGKGYPDVWISYKSIEKLISQQGECAITIDRPNEPPPPPEPDEFLAEMLFDNKIYSGMMVAQS